ncbi:hypothetical protein OIU78_021836 [Salix suchowensis]|nr:hypothetical protein OIU78_021836 [Salix suchowensis]
MNSVFNWKLLVLGLINFYHSITLRRRIVDLFNGVQRRRCSGSVSIPKMPLWKLPNYDSRPRSTATTPSSLCQSAMLQGRRKSQEDRTLCALDFRIPFPGKVGVKGDATYSFIFKKSNGRLPNEGEKDVDFQVLNWGEESGQRKLNFERFKFSLPTNFDDSFHLDILKEALLRAIHDIDATFSKEASRNNLDSGSTATVALMADGQILVANIGDSKALLCSEKFQSPAEAKATLLRIYREQRRDGAVSPARDHHPDRDDERFRVENAGGYVLEWGGVPRVNGQLAVSRAIGDLHLKSYGVISAPEVTDWQLLTTNDSYLVVASDGMFEKLGLQDTCDLLWEVHSHGSERPGLSSSCSYSLAECLVNTAFEKGSMDNAAAVVVPLGSFGISQKISRESCDGEGDIHCSTISPRNFMDEQSANEVTSDLVKLDHGHSVATKFEKLLVKGKERNFGCYYLSENLNNNLEMLGTQNNDDLPQALPEAFNHRYGGPLNLYNDQNMCLHFGMTIDGVKDQCIHHEGFANFLGLLESIPFHDAGSNYGSTEYAMPDLRYVLKKRCGRGSYGEVWLAFYWNFDQDHNASSWSKKNGHSSFDAGFNSTKRNSSCGSADDCSSGSPDGDLFVLKRIMVERGAAFYLSGIREKYFGEVFLNASRCLGDLQSDGIKTSLFEEMRSDYDLLETYESVHGLGSKWSFENKFPNKFRTMRATFEEGLSHIARYVESFESRSNEIWLVFRHEGVSLSKLIYTVEEVENVPDREKVEEVRRFEVLQPSKWWHWLKTTKTGKEEMRNLIWQLLMALKSCHGRNITHRDIKPENMVICLEDQHTGRCLKGGPSGDKNYTIKMRIIDFGSAMDEFTLKHLYGSTGPSRAEQTSEYSPPEAFLNATWYHGSTSANLKYDMWSVGVVMLELILGTPNVFQINARTQALLDPHIVGWNEDLKELAYKLRSFMELCILIPGSYSKHHRSMGQGGDSPASWKCSEEFFSSQIKNRDPLKLGFPNVWALRLVRQLLLWDPEDRLSVDDALRHPYFQPPPKR